MKEIGGYFGLEKLISNEYYRDLIPLNTGRNALLYLLKARQIKKLYIPYYLCNSVSDMCSRNGYELGYYNVNTDFMPIFNKPLADDEYLYVVNYYGQLTEEKVIDLRRQFIQIILDNTHAFFQRPLDGIDTIYSCRKFFGVPDGAYLSTDADFKEVLDVDVSRGRMTHILGRYEGVASHFYNEFQANDASFKTEPLKKMSKLTHNLLGAIDYDRVRRIRNENYAFLERKLSGLNNLKLLAPNGAFAYPFYVTDGTEIRRVLAQNKIYIPTLWPNVLTTTPRDWIEQDYAANILPLPCDQRFGIRAMMFVIKYLYEVVKHD